MNADPGGLMYDQAACRRIIAGHLSNVYSGKVAAVDAVRHLRSLATYAADMADPEAASHATDIANELEAGGAPMFKVGALGISVEPPQGVAHWGPEDEGVLATADIAERNAALAAPGAEEPQGAPQEPQGEPQAPQGEPQAPPLPEVPAEVPEP